MANEYFDFLDQFPEYEVDLTELLTNYNIDFSNEQPVKVTLKNIFEQLEVIDTFKQDFNNFTLYIIKPGEQFYNIAYNLYGDVKYWWIIPVFNNIKNPWFDMPISDEQIVYLARGLFKRDRRFSYQKYIELLTEANEKKTEIYVPIPEKIEDIIWEFRKKFLEYQGVTL